MVFTPEDIQSRLRQQPFQPVRIVSTTNQNYDIRHPELVLVTKRFLIVGLPSAENESVADQVTRVALVHVSELRDLPMPAAGSNGLPA